MSLHLQQMYVGHTSPLWCTISHLVHALWSVFALMAIFLMEVDLDLDLLCEADCDLILGPECLEVLLYERLLLLHCFCCCCWSLERDRPLVCVSWL